VTSRLTVFEQKLCHLRATVQPARGLNPANHLVRRIKTLMEESFLLGNCGPLVRFRRGPCPMQLAADLAARPYTKAAPLTPANRIYKLDRLLHSAVNLRAAAFGGDNSLTAADGRFLGGLFWRAGAAPFTPSWPRGWLVGYSEAQYLVGNNKQRRCLFPRVGFSSTTTG